MSSPPSPSLFVNPAITPRRRRCRDRSATPNAVTKLPAQDLERARAFYRDKLGLEPVEERTAGLRYVCRRTKFHLFSSAGAPSGESTQMAFEVEDLEATLADLRARGVIFERFEMPGFDVRHDTIAAPDNYPSKATNELGTFLHDTGQPNRDRPAGPRGRNTGIARPRPSVPSHTPPGRARCRHCDSAVRSA